MARHIVRDPFARETLCSRTEETYQTCSWCGSKRRETGRLFRYYVERDSGRDSDINGLFCSVGCMRVYHGG